MVVMQLLLKFGSSSPYHLVDLVANDISHLLLFLIDLDFDLSSQFLLLKSIEVANNLKSWLKDDCRNEATEAADHMHDTTSNEVNESKFLEPSFTPYPRCTHGVDDRRNIEGVNNMSTKMSSLSHG